MTEALQMLKNLVYHFGVHADKARGDGIRWRKCAHLNEAMDFLARHGIKPVVACEIWSDEEAIKYIKYMKEHMI